MALGALGVNIMILQYVTNLKILSQPLHLSIPPLLHHHLLWFVKQ